MTVQSAERPEGLDALGIGASDADEVRDPVGRNVAIAVIGLVLILAALVPIAMGAVWVGSIVYAAVLSFLSGGSLESSGTAV